ncbi:MAG: GTP-binding protein [Gemmatimonadaceae bacterium]|nr:GTP-binding protein [Gemmatimonadaceae bacterium]
MLHRALALTATPLIIAGGSSISAQAPAALAPQPNFCPAPARVTSPDSLPDLRPPLVPLPKVVRGLYVNRWAALGDRGWELIGVASHTEVNALVVDVKDDRGFVLYRSQVPLAQAIGADTNRPMSHARLRAMLDSMRVHHIYPIARIVVAKDPLLASTKLEWAIRRKADPSQPWRDKKGNPWLDPHQDGPWHYAADLACEAVDLGFSEIQFDYVRFPDDKRLVSEATFPLARGRLRAQVIREQLLTTRARLKPLGVPVTADVFGLTATDTTDMGIGQKWEQFINTVDVVLPMMYPSHYNPGSYGIGNPNAHPYETIAKGLKDVHRRSIGIVGAAAVRPWYQDFTLGPPHYTATEVRAQIEAGYANGVESWVLWNPRSMYTESAIKAAPERAALQYEKRRAGSAHSASTNPEPRS